MNYPSDIFLSSLTFSNSEHQTFGILPVSVKNLYHNSKPFSVWDNLHFSFRDEYLLIYNQTRRSWQINPYFIFDNYIQNIVNDSDPLFQ